MCTNMYSKVSIPLRNSQSNARQGPAHLLQDRLQGPARLQDRLIQYHSEVLYLTGVLDGGCQFSIT